RSRLHALVDSLPEAALAVAQGSLAAATEAQDHLWRGVWSGGPPNNHPARRVGGGPADPFCPDGAVLLFPSSLLPSAGCVFPPTQVRFVNGAAISSYHA